MGKSFRLLPVIILLLCPSAATFAQNKLLTIDDIFDPAKRVNFNGNPPSPRWLKDGIHYLVVSNDRNAFPRLLKVDAVRGKSEPFYDAAKMQAAFAALPGFGKDDAHRLANQTSYQLNPSETGVLINSANDLFYYEFGSERAIRRAREQCHVVGHGGPPRAHGISERISLEPAWNGRRVYRCPGPGRKARGPGAWARPRGEDGWGGRTRTSNCRLQRPVSYPI